ncbi:MAG: hypothetical protein B6D58_08755 [candidate division Zixibacteria bacterium 4484_95]|nr:MAG: hypothetical protein B6D58_08755 [candidate division Zixibacteria bacterium 4484_95]
MPNELIWLLMAIIDFVALLTVYRIFGKDGLYVAIVISIILCNIQVLKIVELFGVTATLGNILYGSIFLSTDILSEKYGKRQARKGVWFGFYALIFTTIIMQIALLFKPAVDDFISPALQQIFSFMPRVVLASITAYVISQLHDVWLFHILKNKTKGKYLWLRNNLTTMTSQLIDSVIFCFIAFWGVFPNNIFIEILLTTYFIKWCVAFLDTPFIYIARRLRND